MNIKDLKEEQKPWFGPGEFLDADGYPAEPYINSPKPKQLELPLVPRPNQKPDAHLGAVERS